MKIISLYLLVINLVAICMYGWDKHRAKKKKRRVSEKQLICVALLGGSLGAVLAMQMFRHKTKKAKFYLGVPLILILQIGIALYIKYHW